MPPNPNVHYCELKRDTFGLPKLPPNAPWHKKFTRRIRKCLTLNPNSPTSKRFFRNRSTMISEQKRHLSGATYIIHPFSTFNRIRQYFFVLLWTIEMLITPVYVSFFHIAKFFGTDDHMDIDGVLLASVAKNDTIGNIYRYVVSPMQAFIVFLFFFTGYVNTKTKEIVIEPRVIVKRYFLTFFIPDILMNFKFGIYSRNSVYLYLINLCCLFRIGTLFEYIKDIVLSFKVREEVYDCLKLFLVSVLLLNGLNCMFYYTPWMLGNLNFPDTSWPVRAGLTPDNANFTVSRAYLDSMVIVVSHFVGAGDVAAKTNMEDVVQKALLTIIMMCGRLWTLYMIASVLKLFSVVTISESKYEEYLLQLEVYMTQKRLPKVLRSRLLEYYRYKYQNHFFNEHAIFATLSTYLKQELMLFGARKLISKVELFRALPRSVVGAIISYTKQAVYLPNDYIVRRGDIADEIYFISAGTVAIATESGEELVHLEDGDEIGLIGLFSVTPHVYQFTYQAVETTELYCITKKDFKSLIFDEEDLLKYFAKKAQDRVETYKNIELSYQIRGYDLLSEISGGNILEKARLRPTHFEN